MSRCAWCDAEIGTKAKRVDRRLRCPWCGAWTTDPPPDEAELERAYGGWYRPAAGRFSGAGDALLRKLRGSAARRIDFRAPAGPILDVGAGDGALLDALRRRGREATGIDTRPGHPHVLEAELADMGGQCWAAIVFWHSLEHLRESGAVVQRAASMLERDGILVIAMPNPASIQAGVFGERWFANDFPRHLVHVPAGALLGRLSEIGMKVERVSYLRGGQVLFGWLHGFVNRISGGRSLYDAIRRPKARGAPLTAATRWGLLLLAALSLPLALACSALEVALKRGGTVYVEARRV